MWEKLELEFSVAEINFLILKYQVPKFGKDLRDSFYMDYNIPQDFRTIFQAVSKHHSIREKASQSFPRQENAL